MPDNCQRSANLRNPENKLTHWETLPNLAKKNRSHEPWFGLVSVPPAKSKKQLLHAARGDARCTSGVSSTNPSMPILKSTRPLPATGGGCLIENLLFFVAKFCKFLAGSFSAVSKRNFASKYQYAFYSIFKLYKICTFLYRSKRNISAKHGLKNQRFS